MVVTLPATVERARASASTRRGLHGRPEAAAGDVAIETSPTGAAGRGPAAATPTFDDDDRHRMNLVAGAGGRRQATCA